MKYFFEWTSEGILILIHFPVYVLNVLFRLKTLNKNPTEKYPIILVERWFRHNAFHAFPKWYLERNGFETYTINYSMAKGSFFDAAKSLEHFIERHKLRDVVLVGISAGATTCLTYLQKNNGWSKTHLFVSIGGSLKGSPLASKFPVSKSVRELQPNSHFMKELYKEPIKNLDKIYCFVAKGDNLVPRGYSEIKGAHIVHIDMVGHNLLHTFWLPTYRTLLSTVRKN